MQIVLGRGDTSAQGAQPAKQLDQASETAFLPLPAGPSPSTSGALHLQPFTLTDSLVQAPATMPVEYSDLRMRYLEALILGYEAVPTERRKHRKRVASPSPTVTEDASCAIPEGDANDLTMRRIEADALICHQTSSWMKSSRMKSCVQESWTSILNERSTRLTRNAKRSCWSWRDGLPATCVMSGPPDDRQSLCTDY